MPLREYYACVYYLGVPAGKVKSETEMRVFGCADRDVPEHVHRASWTHFMPCMIAVVHDFCDIKCCGRVRGDVSVTVCQMVVDCGNQMGV